MASATPDLTLNLKLTVAPTKVSISGTTARSAALTLGQLYYVTTDIDCYILQGGVAVDATANSVPMWARGQATIYVESATDQYVAVISSGATGTLWLTPGRGN